MSPEFVVTALSVHLPPVMRWAGAIARRMRRYNIGLGGKSSGSALTDALTLADLTVQELLVSALRDADPIFRHCRIQAEESTGDLQVFPDDAELTIALDPIDGTKQYRDKTGNGYAVMAHLRNAETVLHSLVFLPEQGDHGGWVECDGERLVSGPDDPLRPAADVLRSLPNISTKSLSTGKKIYIIGFQHRDGAAAQAVSDAGLEGVAPDQMPGSIYPLLASGEFAGSLIHSPNVYDFPVSLQIARQLGGDAVWVHNRRPVNFQEMWTDDRADMLRLPGIVACGLNQAVIDTLCQVAKDWNVDRYHAEKAP